MLPQLRELEQRFGAEVAFIGVHSGKFTHERDRDAIRAAAVRLGNTHPIVNDRQFRVWRSYAVRAWPTIAVIDARGYVIGTHAGEFTAEQLAPFLEQAIAAARASAALDSSRELHAPETPTIAPTGLRYPGRVLVAGDRLFVADSGNHRVLVARLSGDRRTATVERIVGGEAGYADGAAPRFRHPQGLALHEDTLYVADRGNHAIRAISLATGVTRTIAGTGHQLRTRRDRAAGAMSSPWDVAIVGDRLFVAMAGSHQIWTVAIDTGAATVHCGSGHEDIADGVAGHAALAQPMGLAADGASIYFADAESSAIRCADVATGVVRTIVGTGLFDFGDRDGVGDDARLQHAESLALHPNGRLIVADSYNGALKWVDPQTRAAEKWIGGLAEPTGVAVDERGDVWVAETNAHRIVRVTPDGTIHAVELLGS